MLRTRRVAPLPRACCGVTVHASRAGATMADHGRVCRTTFMGGRTRTYSAGQCALGWKQACYSFATCCDAYSIFAVSTRALTDAARFHGRHCPFYLLCVACGIQHYAALAYVSATSSNDGIGRFAALLFDIHFEHYFLTRISVVCLSVRSSSLLPSLLGAG